ncbi:MAG: hypothetical protein Q8R37_03515 [Nanoarchaeota archaeon]|nr:hypothetical protein [Nanoarchaeota archaeon]
MMRFVQNNTNLYTGAHRGARGVVRQLVIAPCSSIQIFSILDSHDDEKLTMKN